MGLPRRVLSVVPGYLLPGALFVVLPLKLYLPNRDELGSDVLAPFVAAAVAALGAVVALALIPSERWRERVTRALFFLGLYVLLADALAPTTLAILDGQHVQRELPEPLSYTLIEAGLLVGLGIAAVATPTAWVRGLGGLLVLFLCAPDLVHLGLVRVSERRAAVATPAARPATTRPNVYHLIFDGFSSDGFERMLDTLHIRDRFDGFVFFPRNQSNHTLTQFSFPSFLTAELIVTDNFKAWRDGALSGRFGLLHDVRTAGYDTWQYTSASRCRFRPDHCVRSVDAEDGAQKRTRITAFLDLWLLRIAPNVLQDETYAGGRGVFAAVLRAWRRGQDAQVRAVRRIGLLDRLAEDLEKMPTTNQYVYAHFLVPHAPFVLTRNCGYRGPSHRYKEAREVPRAFYEEQAMCVARRIAAFLDRLRALGRYEDAAVVIHADHGNFVRCLDTKDRVLTEETSRSMQAVSLNARSGVTIDCWSRALLLVKPPGPVTRPLVISERHTQLLDLRATVAALAGMRVRVPAGLDVLAPEFPRRRAVELIEGGYQPLDPDRLRFGILCVSRSQGELNSFVYDPEAGGWSIRPNLRVTCGASS